MTFKSIADISETKGDPRHFQPSDEFALPFNKVGVEIEVEHPPNTEELVSKGLWQAVRENSLREVKGRRPIELITLPLFGEDLLNAFTHLDEAFKEGEAQFSARTSVHVHIEVVDMEKEDLIKLLLLYTSLERILFHHCGADRADNLYCLPYYKADHFKTLLYQVFDALTEEDTHNAQSVIYNWPKYSALNLRRIADLGTIEFRQHHGTADSKKILTWIKMLLCIKRYAIEGVKDIHDFPNLVSGFAADEYLTDIFGVDLAHHLVYPGVADDLIKGVRTAQDVLVYAGLDNLAERLLNENIYGTKTSSFAAIHNIPFDAQEFLRIENHQTTRIEGFNPNRRPRNRNLGDIVMPGTPRYNVGGAYAFTTATTTTGD